MSLPTSFDRDDLLRCAHGDLFGPGNLRLPLPPMLMLDRITTLAADGGTHGLGLAIAELDIRPDRWFFEGHFHEDPVMPGCLGLDALWQLFGFLLAWQGHPGKGRAFGVGEVRFKEPILPSAHEVAFQLEVKRVLTRGLVLGIGDGEVSVDGRLAYTAQDLWIGLVAG
jgi:3-hydroxyacyl-[acyl-carrier protein] dehydratase/trans-2-decenoyl-[acyl-carrier protein] isomerase